MPAAVREIEPLTRLVSDAERDAGERAGLAALVMGRTISRRCVHQIAGSVNHRAVDRDWRCTILDARARGWGRQHGSTDNGSSKESGGAYDGSPSPRSEGRSRGHEARSQPTSYSAPDAQIASLSSRRRL